MTQIRITSSDVREMKGVGKTSGKPYHMRFQTGYAFTMDKDGVMSEFPDKFELVLDADQPPYPRGTYLLHSSSIFVSRDGNLSVRPRLVAAPAPAAK